MIRPLPDMDRTLTWALFALVFLAPLPFGAVEPWASGTIEVAIFLLFFIALFRLLRRGTTIRFPLALTALLFVLLHLVQVIPLSSRIVAQISPTSHALFQILRPDQSGNLSQTISLSPDITISSLIWFCSCLSAGYLALIISSNGNLARGPHAAGRDEPATLLMFDIPARNRTEWVALGLCFTLALAGTFQALYGLLEYVLEWNRIFFYVRRYPMGWVAGTFINTNHCAAFLSLCLPPILALILHLRRAAGPDATLFGTGEPDEPARRSPYRNQTLLLIGAAILVSLALLLTHSTGGRLASLASLAFFFLVYRLHRGKSGSRNMALILLLVATLYLVLIFLLLSPELTGSDLMEDLGWDLENRLSIYGQSLAISADFPLFGSGAGTYSQMMLHYSNRMAVHAHNEYLELLCDLGPLGLLCALLLIVFLIRRSASVLRQEDESPQPGLPDSYILPLGFITALLALALHSVVDFPLRIPAIALAGACIFGVLVGLLADQGSEPTS